jgi:hypothetical protein
LFYTAVESHKIVEDIKTVRQKTDNRWKEQDKDNHQILDSGFVVPFTIINRKQDNLDLFPYAHFYGFLAVGTLSQKHSFGIENRITKNYFCAMRTIADIGFIFVHTVFNLRISFLESLDHKWLINDQLIVQARPIPNR